MPPDLACEGEPVGLGHHQVEDGHVERLAFLDPGERVGGGRDRHGLHAPRSRVARHDLAVRRVVVHHEEPLAGELRHRARHGHASRQLRCFRGELDVEGRSLALLALHPHRPVHQLDETLRDGEPEPGAAVAAGGGGVDLAEGREQPLHPVLGDADPGVANGELESVRARPGWVGADVDDHLARLGELDRVRDEVEQYLPQAGRVPHDSCRHVLVDEAAQLELLLPRTRCDDVERALDTRPEIDRLLLELELARLDLRVVEDVVDHVEQRVSARADHLGELALLGGQLRPEEEAGHADHGVHRRPDLVAHRGEEGALRLCRRLRLLARPLELADVTRLVDRRRREGGEGLCRLRVLGGVEVDLERVERQHPDQAVAGQQRDRHPRPDASLDVDILELGIARCGVRDDHGLVPLYQLPGRIVGSAGAVAMPEQLLEARIALAADDDELVAVDHLDAGTPVGDDLAQLRQDQVEDVGQP